MTSVREFLFLGTAQDLIRYQYTRSGELLAPKHSLEGSAIHAITALDADILLVTVDGRPTQQSFDGGDHWSDSADVPPQPIGLQVATIHGPAALNNPRLLGATAYARLAGRPATLLGAGADGMLLFRSEDEGIHWEAAALPYEIGRITTLIPSVAERDSAWGGTDQGTLLHSRDRGRSWMIIAQEHAAILCLAATV